MRLKFSLVGIVILFCSINVTGQVYESLEKEAADVFISLSNKDTGYTKEIENLNSVLSIATENKELEKTYLTSQAAYDSLKDHFKSFQKESENISLDSTLVLFNDWYLHFQNIFYEYSKQKFFSSPKQKILFFSTSMSCYCTLKVSRNQTVDLLKFISENTGDYDYWIIDSYWHNDLQIYYETLFAPSVIVFNGNNEVLFKIEYDEKMIALLTNFLDNESKTQGF